ncbi:HpcH/HpaI aldolase/citrate lyase family protein [Croceicoccus mobilis]|uniref:Citrate lyase subunit beta n=1 Tax=Croceicoccus mobilis TaxID=1703339 RepID=A0A917DP10_9SPHN|nr:HpcH/HpaI aldolase/citrate lyase family protein [Croceicoccus mobilis]GGD56243.1 citrate lyase subunit beta [Croceicoccus mobilis]
MSRHILGATLYIPATRPNIETTLHDEELGLRSAVICLEDSVGETDIERAQAAFEQFLRGHQPAGECRVYARPRDIAMLAWMLRQPGIEKIAGFVLPKITTTNIGQWLELLLNSEHAIMPTIEGEEAFDLSALQTMRAQLLPFVRRVDAIRIGGNDILNILGARRSKNRTAYDGPLGQVIRDFAATFIPAGFSVSSPVFEHFARFDILEEEIERDLEHGVMTKTAIHPDQVRQIHALYRPRADEVAEARAILASDALAVFGSNGSMCEPATHRSWAATIMSRAQAFGIETHENVTPIRVA